MDYPLTTLAVIQPLEQRVTGIIVLPEPSQDDGHHQEAEAEVALEALDAQPPISIGLLGAGGEESAKSRAHSLPEGHPGDAGPGHTPGPGHILDQGQDLEAVHIAPVAVPPILPGHAHTPNHIHPEGERDGRTLADGQAMRGGGLEVGHDRPGTAAAGSPGHARPSGLSAHILNCPGTPGLE